MPLFDIYTVLRSGGEYGPRHVQWLARQVAQHCTLQYRLVCLSDVEIEGVETEPLKNDWPRWWPKLELFKRERGFFLDLDTVIVGNIDALVSHPHTFTALQDFYFPQRMGSGLMAWGGNYRHLHDGFSMEKACRGGDQAFILPRVKKWDRWQALFPGAVHSYKATLNRKDPPPSARIVCFHGKPRPWEVKHDWIPEL
jgi:hypothetical protein